MTSLSADQRVWPEDVSVIILCGGKGTRLQSVVSDRPKPMADIGGKPFLDWQIDYAGTFGFRRFILCTGYMADVIEGHYRRAVPGREILFSREEHPLGTGGAVKKALLSYPVATETSIVLNGDTFCRIDYSKMFDFHLSKGSLLTVVVSAAEGNDGYGHISLDEKGRITSFQEKTSPENHHYVNAGIYMIQRKILDHMPLVEEFSLEYDLFPGMCNKTGCFGYVSRLEFMDIGAPERYQLVRKEGF